MPSQVGELHANILQNLHIAAPIEKGHEHIVDMERPVNTSHNQEHTAFAT